MKNDVLQIESRGHLLSVLTEAAELEHNLMCLYLYAFFSIKENSPEWDSDEKKAVHRWRQTIREIAIQEMGHLAIVNNIICAVGGTAHFFRPNFPVTPGYYPSDFVVQLSPFNLTTLEHFIFLERPEGERIPPSPAFIPETHIKREAPIRRLMTHTGDYKTVGELYEVIKEGIKLLGTKDPQGLFCGNKAVQLTSDAISMDGLELINSVDAALRAIDTIVEQGEGGSGEESHFSKFMNMKDEYLKILKKNPEFLPAYPCVRNPVMRKPLVNLDQYSWVNHPVSSEFLDIGNACYSLMLRYLTQIYGMGHRTVESKKRLLRDAFVMMRCLSISSSGLATLPADQEHSGNAGLSFSLDRHYAALDLSSEVILIRERLLEIATKVRELKSRLALSKELKMVLDQLENQFNVLLEEAT